ncbi:DUF2442 domain-containing protein [Paraclostridium sordellii]|uniref:DUF2442 domain-containing protein n=1 Tax=Paraclostridium sordellii TaxID=1505 RepID=UPI0005DA9E16|nr:DUF2442 domain-containing protein [Paeniclostridium sordellii]CEP45238.1 Protein of uncharacterised function (DUF2442) [[Clostridium] sordellii] [Paeniclostridium sordellii]
MVRRQLTFIGVVPMDGYLLKFYLNSGGIALLNMKPFLEKRDFIKLKDWEVFKTVKLDAFHICINHKVLPFLCITTKMICVTILVLHFGILYYNGGFLYD